MTPCNKRQTIVKRSKEGSSTVFRCLNKKSGLHGQEVDEAVCSRCPTPSVEHKRPCRKFTDAQPSTAQPPVTAEELNSVSDEELKAMIEEAGLDPEEFSQGWAAADITPVGPGQPPPNYPPISLQLWTYKEALIRWWKAGKPVRTQEEVARLHKLCTDEPCEWYDEDAGRCKGCGCKVSVSSIAVANKLKMATEHCPQEKF